MIIGFPPPRTLREALKLAWWLFWNAPEKAPKYRPPVRHE